MDTLGDLPERELMQRLRSGDEQALAETYRRHARLVHSLALRATRSAPDAEDITQKVFVALWQSRDGLDPDRGNLAAWLTTTTRRRCVDLHAQQSRRRTKEGEGWGPAEPGSWGNPEEAFREVLLAQQLETLGEPRGRILRMAVIDGFTHTDIAQRLGLPLGTVKSHVRRALITLREHLEETDRGFDR